MSPSLSQEKEIELLYNRESLELDRVTLKLAGLYQCIASNNIGESTSKNFIVNVVYPPEVSVEKQWIHSAPDMRAEVVCNVYANPPAKVSVFLPGLSVHEGIGRSLFLCLKNLENFKQVLEKFIFTYLF